MSYCKTIEQNRKWIDETFKKLDKKLSATAVKSRDKIPYTTVDGVHDDQSGNIHAWTNGFWGGLMWLMYAATENEEYRITAEKSENLLERAFDNVEMLNHDVGFMWHLTSGANYRLTGNLKSRNRNLLAAMTLASRYNPDGNFIRAWNIKERAGWTIIDCMMNVNQLYWASEELGAVRFKKIAECYADMAMRDHVRADGSVNHIVIHDVDKPDTVLGINAGQGYSEDSCWSRGSGWAIYGFVLSYIHTGEKKYLDTAVRAADYFIQNVKKTDWLTLLDFKAPDTPVYYDSTAGAIAACGIIEIAKYLPEKADEYLQAALNILIATEKNWCNWESNEDSVLQMGSECYRKGIHKPIIYGDYFFAEAILKLKGCNFLPW